MSDQPEKPKVGKKKHITDIEKPGESAPSSTSKPVIVSNRPVLKDPMVVEKDNKAAAEKPVENTGRKELKRSGAPTIQPLDEPAADEPSAESTPDKPAAELPSRDAEEPAGPETPDEQPEGSKPEPETTQPKAFDMPEEGSEQTKPTTDAEKKLAAEEAKQAEHDAEIQKLVEEGQYILPIHSAQQQKAKHFVVIGVIFAVLLVLVWLDIALDAHIISLGGLHPVTHFFTN